MLGLIGAGIGLLGGIGKMFGRGRANRELEKLIGQNPQYQINDIAKRQYALTQNQLMGRMPGAASIEKNILSNQANIQGQIDRNATDSSQALALLASTQGQTNQNFNDLGTQEAQDYQRRLNNYLTTGATMINEGDKVYNDQVRRFNDLVNIRGAQQQNRQNNFGDISNFGFGMMNLGLNAGGDKQLIKKLVG